MSYLNTLGTLCHFSFRIGTVLCLTFALALLLCGPAMVRAEEPPTEPVCGEPAVEHAKCLAVELSPEAEPSAEGSGIGGTYGPADLLSAYGLSTAGGSGSTIAIVDAYDDPNAEEDLSFFRSYYGLSECTTANGCFKKVNQSGGSSYPAPNVNWSLEISLDLDVASSICPECKLLLVEATDNSDENLGIAVNRAATLGATVISNSWGSAEFSSQSKYESYFNHPGIPITVAAGDSGYEPSFPAVMPTVISVGGTTLTKSAGPRGWAERVWEGSGGGCSAYEPKPSWQTDPGCSLRMTNDVAAVANPETGIGVRDTYGLAGGGWWLVGGTSASAPLIAGIEARASKAVREQGPEAFYGHALNDVVAGSNGGCHFSYFCDAGEGYDGPSGWGTPNGPLTSPVGFNAITGAATGVSASGATVNGYVDPEGKATSYRLEYGPTDSYGTSAPVPNGAAGSGSAWKNVGQSISGLEEGTYHYRVVASNGLETVYGEDHKFTTQPWSVQKLPKNYLGAGRDVACTSSEFCLVVGANAESKESASWALAHQWTGTEWSSQPPAKPAGATGSTFTSVSCPSPTACTAVGSYSEGTSHALVERWNGTSWAIQTTPSPNKINLTGVSCPTESECIAVGEYQEDANHTKPVAEKWNGSGWTSIAPVTPAGAARTKFDDLSCSSATSCLGVGSFTSESNELLAERWNGSEWTLESPKKPGNFKRGFLTGVSCPAVGSCEVVGWFESTTPEFQPPNLSLAERVTGTTWTVQPVHHPANGEDYFEAVTCISSSRCEAVGSSWGEDAWGPQSQSWNGSNWTVQGNAWIEGTPETPMELEAVSCWAAQACAATGTRIGPVTGFGRGLSILTERTTLPIVQTESATSITEGGATLVGKVNPEGVATTYHFEYGLTTAYGSNAPVPDAAAGSGRSAVEVGKAITGLESEATYHYRLVATNALGVVPGQDLTFTTAPRSGAWAQTSAPNPAGAKSDYSWSVSCTSPFACTGVGDYVNSSGVKVPFAERWNGSSWALQSVPAPAGAKESTLEGVSCASASLCVATGWYLNSSGTYMTLAEVWEGKEWKIQSTPNPAGSLESLVFGVSCPSTSFCLSVGNYSPGVGKSVPFGEAWNGKEWSLVSLPAPAEAKESSPFWVSCTSASACSAVGEQKSASGEWMPLAERLSGSTWAVDSVPLPAGYSNGRLRGVSCTAAGACTAVGTSYVSPSLYSVGFAERWNGSAWSSQAMPMPAGQKTDAFFGVSCSSSNTCMTTGNSHPESGQVSTLAESWNGSEWSVRSTPNPEKGGGLTGGVSCPSSDWCAAIGTSSTSTTVGQVYSTPQNALTELPAAIGVTTATLAGTVNPSGIETSYQFEYGTSLSYGSVTPASPESLGAGLSGIRRTQVLTSLAPHTLYHFRIAATTALGTTYGVDRTFTTGSILRWYACKVSGGGKYRSGRCQSEGAPSGWELGLLKEGEESAVAAAPTPFSYSATIGGVEGTITCEAEASGAKIENPIGAGTGVGQVTLTYKGCTGEGNWEGCKVTPSAVVASKLQLTSIEGKTELLIMPAEGTSFVTFTLSECSVSGSYKLTGSVMGLFSNVVSKLEVTPEAAGSSLRLGSKAGPKVTPAGAVRLEMGGGYVRADP